MRKPNQEQSTRQSAERKPFSSRSFKSGSYSLAMCAVVMVIVVLVNLIVAALPSKITEPDISAGNLFTLSDYSKQIVQGLKTDVTIYLLASESSKDERVSRLLDRYAEASDKIKVEMRDPEISQIASKYTKDAVSANTLIVVSEKRNKVVDYSALYSYSSEAMNAYYSYGQSNPDEFCGEREITSALSFVTSDVLPKVYALTGHGEYEIGDTLKSAIASDNIELDTLDLVTARDIPDDCACLLLLSPSSDLSEKENETILDYLDNGGRLLAATMTKDNLKTATPHYDALLKNCGVIAQDGFIVETDRSACYYYQTYLMPTLGSHEITDPISDSNYHVCIPICRYLESDPDARADLTVTPLLTTSDGSFARTDTEIETAEMTDSDIAGPFDVGFAVTAGEGEQEMRAVIFGSTYFMDESLTSFSGNTNLLLNSLKWMCDLEENISVVDVKSMASGGSLEVDDMMGMLWITILVFVIPFAFLVVGIVIYVQRKKR